MGGRSIDITGQRFYRLTVISVGGRANREFMWNCVCDCGGTAIIRGNALRKGLTRSCGCLLKESREQFAASRRNVPARRRTPEYRTWKRMKGRCNDKNNKYFHRYGGRGIRVCERWREFDAFLADMGPRPSPKHSIDRIDVNGNYEPSNCRWATIVEQNNNRGNNRIICIEGRSDTLANWVRFTNINPYNTVSSRIINGIDPRRALQM